MNSATANANSKIIVNCPTWAWRSGNTDDTGDNAHVLDERALQVLRFPQRPCANVLSAEITLKAIIRYIAYEN
jgi:hypothetical protein